MTLFLIVSFFFLLPVFAFAAEKIEYYEVNIEPHFDGSFIVEEIIQYDFGNEERHGIFRDIPTKNRQESSSRLKERYADIEILSVTVDGNNGQYTASDSWGTLAIQIGDPDITIFGRHTYKISYSVQGGLQYFDDGTAELYWDAIGTEWPVSIEKAVVIVNSTDDLVTGKTTCYVGSEGDRTECADASLIENKYYNILDKLPVGHGVTIAYELNSEKVSVVMLERYLTQYFLLFGIIFLLIVGGIWSYRYKTEFKTGNAIIPHYEPYEDFKPMYTGILLDGRLDPKDITACIVYLAQQGYIKIKKLDSKKFLFFESKDYEITLTKALDENVSRFQKRVLGLMFATPLKETVVNPDISLESLKNLISPGKYISTFEVGERITLSALRSNSSKQKVNWKTIKNLKTDLEKDLEENGFFQLHFTPSVRRVSISVTVIIVIAYLFSVTLAVLAGVGVLLIALFSNRRTRKGYEALDYLKGFKQFLSVTEAERYTFHNAPQKSPEQFMEYLPYAIAFGVEKQWSKVFEDITIPNPDWYDGGSNAAAFSAVNLTTSLGAFSSAFASSSGSSSSGGSGGGGSVGGGGGGGGGGSW